MRGIVLIGLTLLLAACNPAADGDGKHPGEAPGGLAPQALLDARPLQVEPAPPRLEPIELGEGQHRALLHAIAGSEQASRIVRLKGETGHVQLSAGGVRDLAAAERDLAEAMRALGEMSRAGLPTYLLLHRISSDRVLWSWLIGPEGVIAVDRGPRRFDGLDHVVDGLGVTRLAATRSRRAKGEAAPSAAAQRAAKAEDQSPRSRAERRRTIRAARDMVLPGAVGAALGKASGRLLVIAAEDTGTAPYAALPLANGPAAGNWSFVVMPDIRTLAGEAPTFDHRGLDLGKAVIVGDPDLSDDPLYDWDPLPGARREARLVAERLGVPEDAILLGPRATHRSLRSALMRLSGEGLVYIASHAVADSRNPLTRGFVAMTGEHYYAGYIRTENFADWKRQPPLVVVSACQTALGRVLDGGGFGVTQSWYEAGAGQVVGSLWNVSDPATLLLMHHFTKRLVAGDAPEIAMQYAQQRTMVHTDDAGDQPFLDDPKMWASFTIFGKPSREPLS